MLYTASRADLSAPRGTVLDGAARSPQEWRAPYGWTAESAGELVDVGDGHRVRMQPGGLDERLSA